MVQVPHKQVAHPMIRAQMTLKDGKTPGAMRQGAAAIEVCLASGCRIYPNPLNRIPDEYQQHVLSLDNDDNVGRVLDSGTGARGAEQATSNAPRAHTEVARPKKGKRGRPRKVKP